MAGSAATGRQAGTAGRAPGQRAPARLWAVVLALVALLASLPVLAESALERYAAAVPVGELVPGADRYGSPRGKPAVLPALQGDRLLGFVFLTTDFGSANGYSGKPIHVLGGIGSDGQLTGARLVEHKEPIVLVGIPEERIQAYIAGFVGRKPVELVGRSTTAVDVVSGATVTVMVIADTLVHAGSRVARQHGLGVARPEGVAATPSVVRTVDTTVGAPADWATLLGEGAVRRLSLSVGEVSEAFRRAGNATAAERPERPDPAESFIDLYVAQVSVPAIGRSLLGETGWNALSQRLQPGQSAILVAGSGAYSFKGSGYVRGGIFDRIELVQGDETIRFRDRQHQRLGDIAAEGAPAFPEIGLFLLPPGSTFDPTQPWRLQLLVQRQTGALDKAFITFELAYSLPERFVRQEQRAVTVTSPAEPLATSAAPTGASTAGTGAESAAAPASTAEAAAGSAETATPEPLWMRLWRAKAVSLGVVVTALLVLTGIYFFQHPLVRRPELYARVRLAFLVFTLVWLGWIAQAQLSVVNVLTFTSALLTGFAWEAFLLDPLIFVLWFAVAAALLFWGRGPFCGWLCPFGALQELANRGARRLKIKQITVPWGLHERLWPVKYVIFLVLFGLSLYSLALAEQASEVEPFKTAIVLHFLRSWPFVAFAVAMVAASLFIERFYCRYLCPLGAALAIPGRLRMFDWLRRYRDCGNPCQRCANECPVQAIHPEGHINPNECIGCLHCQMLYHHDQKCPVMITRRQKREKRAALMSASMRPDQGGTTLRPEAAGRPSIVRAVKDGAPLTSDRPVVPELSQE